MYHKKYRPLLLNSLFVRVEKYIEPLMLEKQYRMHRDIALFPSTHFYAGRLSNDSNIERGDRERAFHGDPSAGALSQVFTKHQNITEMKTKTTLNLYKFKLWHTHKRSLSFDPQRILFVTIIIRGDI